jgi:hypothetical protein
MRRLAALALAILAAVAIPAAAQETPAPAPGAEDGRYTFHRVQDNFVRLDGRTGQVALCGHGAAGWTCQAVADERAALESEIARLQTDNAALKKELLARGLPLPGGVKPDAVPPVAKAPDKAPDKSDKPPELRMPSDADLERMKSFFEDVWRRLVEMIGNLQRDMQRKG